MFNKLSNPARQSVLIAVTYILFSGLYIHFSTQIAQNSSISIETLAEIEHIKGLLFIILTGVALFVFTYISFLSLEKNANRVINQQKALVESEKKATASIFAAIIAHDSTNVLASMRFCLKLLERHNLISEDKQGQKLLDTLKKATSDLSHLNKKMLNCSKDGLSGDLKTCDLVEEIKASLDLCKVNDRINGCTIRLEGVDSLFLKMNPLLVNEMILNLALNAGDATLNQGIILIKVLQDDNSALIEIHDNGAGIKTAKSQDIFDAFYTTKSNGTGLGLFSVKACAELHDGRVSVSQSPVLGGALFSIWIPLKQTTHH